MPKSLLKYKRLAILSIFLILMISVVVFGRNSISGLIHKFNDSGHLLKTLIYSDNKLLYTKEFTGPPVIKLNQIASAKNYYHTSLPPYGNFLNSWSL